MIAVIQRVKRAGVSLKDGTTSEIGKGLLCFIGVGKNDSREEASQMADKTLSLRIFDDDTGKMNLNVRQIGGEILSVPQFTLLGRLRKGNRPSFDDAAAPEKALALWKFYNNCLSQECAAVKEGAFGKHMDVSLLNDGPVTIILKLKP
jgi:D-aminoacyl-tRNA deacylase